MGIDTHGREAVDAGMSVVHRLPDGGTMADLSKPKTPHDPWFIGFPFLAAPRSAGSARRERRRSSWLIALGCRLRRTAIDRELAAGADPDSSECRHLRASQLTSEGNREALAGAYERLLDAATSFPPLDVLPVNWRAVRAARPRLERLAHRLRKDRGVRAQGVARARLLLTDQNTALHVRDPDSRLTDEVRSTLALL
jgi:hypothetical protein